MIYQERIIWPPFVYVLTAYDLRGGIAYPGCDEDNNPTSSWLWMHAEVRLLPMSGRFLHLLCDSWAERFIKIFSVLQTKNIKHELPDLYNATWASFGYVNNQCPKALSILSLVQPSLVKKKL